MNFFKASLAFALLSSACLVEAQPNGPLAHPRLQVSSTWTDNISSTSHLPTLKSGQYVTLNSTLDHTRQLDRNWLLIAEAGAELVNVPEFSALDSISATGQVKARRKFGLGPYAPYLQIHLAATVSHVEENPRSGFLWETGARLAKRLNHSLQIAGGINWDDYNAKHRTFDVRTHQVYLEGIWDITDRWRLSAGANRAWGHYVANADGNIWPLAIGGQLGQEIFQHYNTLAWEVSDSFGPGWVAYRNRASTMDHWWVELSPALSDKTSLSLRYQSSQTSNAIGILYEAVSWTFGLNHQF